MARETQHHGNAGTERQQPAVRSNEQSHERELSRSDPWTTSWSGGPFGFMRRMMNEMDRMFEDIGFGGAQSPFRRSETGEHNWTPRVDVEQRGDTLLIRADLPGVRHEDMDVEVEPGALRIRGERREERHEGEGGYHRNECMYGTFVRTIPLPEGVDAEKVTAHFSNGVLEVTVPAPERRGRRIEIGSRPESAAGATTH
jgi:HSP20 family protein